LAIEYDNACGAKDDLRKAYEECNHIPQETRALIDTFLKERSNKDYEMHNSLFGKAAKIEKQMNAKLVSLREKYNNRSQTHIDFKYQRLLFCYKYLSSSPHFLTQLLIQLSQIDSNFNNENDPWEFGLDIDDFDLHLTPVLRSSNSTRVEPSLLTPNPVRIIPGLAGIVQLSSITCVEPSPSTSNPIRIIPGLAGIVQQAKLLKEIDILLGWDGAVMSTQEYMKKVVEDVGDDEDFNSGSKLEQVVAIVKSCSPNAIGDLTVTMKDLSGGAMILANVLIFTHKPSKHYLNITMRNVVKVFRKDTVPGSESDSD
nr:hypothetical protein [Tanacetum cinerariifolium]